MKKKKWQIAVFIVTVLLISISCGGSHSRKAQHQGVTPAGVAFLSWEGVLGKR